VDTLYLFLISVSIFFTALICFLILFFGIRYRRGTAASRANPPENKYLELMWATIPFLLSMVMFGWGAVLFSEMRQPPPDAVEINVVGKQWMWKAQHPEGRAEINELHLPVGQPVRLRMISEDVIHSFYVPAFRVKQDVLPGYYSSMWFEPTQAGQYHLFCAEYCGTEHSKMIGTITVMPPDEYANWLSGETGDPPQVAGAKLFDRFRCGSCHKTPDQTGATGPTLVGLFGSKVPLKDNGMAVANEQYLRDSILNPSSQIVAGYQPLMPNFAGQLNESQVLQLIAYVKSLSAPQAAPAATDSK
jgi:cytochrome c oxidase subunit 2